MVASALYVGAGQEISPTPNSALVGSVASLSIERTQTSSIPAAQANPASTLYDTSKSAIPAANVPLPATALQAAHDAVFGQLESGLLGVGRAVSDFGLAAVKLDLGCLGVSATSLPQPCASSKSTKK
jgi:hypothetical protein